MAAARIHDVAPLLDFQAVKMVSAVQLLRSLGNLATLVAGALQLVGGRLARAIAARNGRGAVRRNAGDLSSVASLGFCFAAAAVSLMIFTSR
jgi:hypothetical protein